MSHPMKGKTAQIIPHRKIKFKRELAIIGGLEDWGIGGLVDWRIGGLEDWWSGKTSGTKSEIENTVRMKSFA